MSEIFDILKSVRDVRAEQLLREDQYQAGHDAEMQYLKHETAKRVDFLQGSNAIPTNAKMYAAWLLTYLVQGGSVTHSSD